MESFRIIYEGEAFDVDEGSKLAVEFVSSVFNEEQILSGSFTYPVVCPPTDKNKRLFGHGHLLENRLARKGFDVSLELLGFSWKRAKLVYDVTPRGYECSLLIDVGTVAEWMRDRPLNSVFTISNNGAFVKHIGISLGASDAEMRNNVADSCQNPGKYPWVFFPYLNEGVFADREGMQTTIINSFVQLGVFAADGFYTPFFYTTWVIKEVCRWLGFEAKGSFLGDEFVRSLVIYNNGIVRKSIRDDRMVYPAQHLPSISVNSFFKALRNDMRCAIYFDSSTRTAYFEMPDVVLDGLGENTSLLGSVKHGTRKTEHNDTTGYLLRAKIDESDNLYEVRPYTKTYVVGEEEGAKSQDMAVGTLFMRSGVDYRGATARLPHVQQIGNVYDDAYSTMGDVYNPEGSYCKNDFVLRMLSYRGVFVRSRPFLSSIDVPFANSDTLNIAGEETYPVGMQPGGERGYLNKMCLNWYRFLLHTERVEMQALLDVVDFARMSPLRHVLIPGDMQGRLSCLMDKVVFEPKLVGEQRYINAKVVVMPHYNIGAVQDVRPLAFEEGEVQIPEERIYIQLVYDNKRYITNTSREKHEVANLKLLFYKDQFKSIPANVNNLIVYINFHTTGTEGNSGVMAFRVTGQESAIAVYDRTLYYYSRGALFGLFKSTDYRIAYTMGTSPTDSYVPLAPAPDG